MLEKDGENQLDRVENKYYKGARRIGTFYAQYKEGKLPGLVTSCRNFLLTHVIEGEVEGRIEVIGRRGRRLKQLLDDLKETRRYRKLKEEALDHTVWRTRFGRGCGSVVRQITVWMND